MIRQLLQAALVPTLATSLLTPTATTTPSPWTPGDRGAAASVDPTALPSLGDMPRRGFVIDTDALTFDGRPGGVLLPDPDGRLVAVFTFNGGAWLPGSAVVRVQGNHPLALGVLGDLTIDGVIDASGFDALGTSGGAGGPGAGAGGTGATCGSFPTAGSGTGGGQPGILSSGPGTGAGGGGFGNTGGKGEGFGGGGGNGGIPYGDLFVLAEGGSGGGGGGATCPFGSVSIGGGGGGGGGSISITALHTISIDGGTLSADGGRGADGSGINIGAGGGGGSGGGIVLRAFNIELAMDATLSADGGDGGDGTNSGGHGAGGRILFVHNTLGAFCDLTVNSIAAAGVHGDVFTAGTVDVIADSGEGAPPVPAGFSLPLDVDAFASLGALPAGDLHFDTTTGSFNAPGTGAVLDQGACLPELCVFTFDGGAVLAPGATITASGDRPLVLLFHGDLTLAGNIDASAADGTPGGSGFAGLGGAAGPGGFPGARGGFCDDVDGFGFGGGVGGASSASSFSVTAGKGGGYGGLGGHAAGFGGETYGDLSLALQAGSGGGGGGSLCLFGVTPTGGGGGGGGGGAVYIGASGTITGTGATLTADGGNGDIDAANQSAGGSGSGGAIVLAADAVVLDAATTLSAAGGDRLGASGGGGGRIAIVTSPGGFIDNTLSGGLSVAAGPSAGDGVLSAAVCQPSLGFAGAGHAVLGVCGEGLKSGDVSTCRLATESLNSIATLSIAFASASTPMFFPQLGGTLVAYPYISLPSIPTDIAGRLEFPVVGGGGPLEFIAQAWVIDPTSATGFALSNAVSVTFEP